MGSPTESCVHLLSTDIEHLQNFHQTHFAGQDVPAISSTSRIENEGDEDDGLGYYNDGVKRTLTDEQIGMFRHSEIQRLLSERKQAQAQEKESQRRQRRQDQKATRPRRFDDEPVQRAGNVDMLTYDDVPGTEQDHQPMGERKFLWPVLGS